MSNSVFSKRLGARSLFKKIKNLRGSFVLALLILIALLSNVLANEWPLFAIHQGKVYFPAMHNACRDLGLSHDVGYPNVSFFQTQDFEVMVHAPIPYSPNTMDERNSRSVSPWGFQDVTSFSERHWLGTDELGHDVLAVLIHGTRLALLVGAGSMFIAGLLGLLLGALAGYFGDDRLRMTRARLLLLGLGLFLGLFYAFSVRYYLLKDAYYASMLLFVLELSISLFILLGVLFASNFSSIYLAKITFFSKTVAVPLDMLIVRSIEVLTSLPILFLILALVALVKPSLTLVIVIIGLTSWTGIARLVRAEMLRIRSLSYMEASQALGYSPLQSVLKHALPNTLEPVFVALAFGFANAILIESVLSFLGLGVPPEVLTWGALLAEARQSYSSWWLAVMPGLAIFTLVYACNNVADDLSKRRTSGKIS